MKKAKNCTDYIFNLVIQYWQLLELRCFSVLKGDSCLVFFNKILTIRQQNLNKDVSKDSLRMHDFHASRT